MELKPWEVAPEYNDDRFGDDTPSGGFIGHGGASELLDDDQLDYSNGPHDEAFEDDDDDDEDSGGA